MQYNPHFIPVYSKRTSCLYGTGHSLRMPPLIDEVLIHRIREKNKPDLKEIITNTRTKSNNKRIREVFIDITVSLFIFPQGNDHYVHAHESRYFQNNRTLRNRGSYAFHPFYIHFCQLIFDLYLNLMDEPICFVSK